jgi:hypothetical protein
MRLTKLAAEVRYNMSETLSRAPRDEDEPAGVPSPSPPRE